MADWRQPSPTDVAGITRLMRIIYFTLLASLVLYWPVAELVFPKKEARELGIVKNVFQLLAAGTGAGVLYLRFVRIPPVLDDVTGDLATRLARLRLYYLVCHTLSEAVGLYGFALHFLGASRTEEVPFFAAAVTLFLLCYPRTPAAGSPDDSGRAD